MKNPQFINNKIYHVFNRGVEKREVFLDTQDYARFIHSLFEFNDKALTINTHRSFNPNDPMFGVRLPTLEKEPRKLLVEILIFTLMPNHFHLLLKQLVEGGISKFMQKIGTGYTNYFNKKYERVGSLFQGKFKAVDIIENAHFIHIPHYIHTNSLDIKDVRSQTPNIEEQMKFLEDYKWSSFQDYIGKKNFPSVTQREFLLDFWGGSEKYKKETKEWLKDWKDNSRKIKEITLD